MTPAAITALADNNMENFIAAITPGGIERQEKQGQIEQGMKETLPINGTSGKNRAMWESMGFQFLDNADDIFVNVKFPPGWKKVPSESAYWTDLIDDKGRKRASIFYKAAFYDRHSIIHPEQRFRQNTEYSDEENTRTVTITDSGKVIHTVGVCSLYDRDSMDLIDSQADAWLKQNYPDWRNPAAYWD